MYRRTMYDPLASVGAGFPFPLFFNHDFAEIEEAAATGTYLSEIVVPSYLLGNRQNAALSLVGVSANITSHHATAFTGALTAYLKLNGNTIATLVSSTVAISGATNATPIVITSAAHGLQTGDTVQIKSVGGNTNANGIWTVTVLSSTTFSLNGSAGNSGYTSGGVVRKQRFDIDLRTDNTGIKIAVGDILRLDVDSGGSPENFTGIQLTAFLEAFGIVG